MSGKRKGANQMEQNKKGIKKNIIQVLENNCEPYFTLVKLVAYVIRFQILIEAKVNQSETSD